MNCLQFCCPKKNHMRTPLLGNKIPPHYNSESDIEHDVPSYFNASPILNKPRVVINTTLLNAVIEDSIVTLVKLLDDDIDLNAVDKDGRTALILAAYHGRKNILTKLLDKMTPKEIIAADKFYGTARLWSIIKGNSDITTLIENAVIIKFANSLVPKIIVATVKDATDVINNHFTESLIEEGAYYFVQDRVSLFI